MAEDRVRELAAAAGAAREESARAKLAAKVLTTERDTLQKLLAPAREADHPPVLDHIRWRPATRWRSAPRSATISKRRSPRTRRCIGAR